MASSCDGPFATDLRRLSPSDAAAVRAVSKQRFGTYYSDLNPLDAYDVLVHIPHVTQPTSTMLPSPARQATSGKRSAVRIGCWLSLG